MSRLSMPAGDWLPCIRTSVHAQTAKTCSLVASLSPNDKPMYVYKNAWLKEGLAEKDTSVKQNKNQLTQEVKTEPLFMDL